MVQIAEIGGVSGKTSEIWKYSVLHHVLNGAVSYCIDVILGTFKWTS